MNAGRLSKVFLGVVLAASGAYVLIYLGRWEWNRSLLAGIFFLAAEVAMATAIVLQRMRSMERSIGQGIARARAEAAVAGPPPALARIQETAPPPSDPFAWLRPRSDQFGVVGPILMGVGVVASGLAWLVERLARATARPALERGLAEHLRVLAWPDRPLDQPDVDVRSLLAGPARAVRSTRVT
jgi:hypothetical protein